MHTRVHSYSWSGGPYSYSTAGIIAACIRPIRGRKGVGCTCNTRERSNHSGVMRVRMSIDVGSRLYDLPRDSVVLIFGALSVQARQNRYSAEIE